ncbi:MAG: hypothetical protein K0R03_1070 [Moraxellaceae bacterium]|jgi:hypothetical protein|nr:hypothetical protein [Moraxellaceae bacterium]MDF3030512.1 hypothetical protein [Moraxellaceae bacterium]
MMNRNMLSVAAMVAGLLGTASIAQAADTGIITIPVVNLDNPCTSGHDYINGTLSVKGVLQITDGVKFLTVSGKGSGTDYNGLQYQYGGKLVYKYHDPLPAIHYHKLRLVSAGSTDNAFITCAIHVNELGVITKLEIGDVECRG